MAIRPTGVSLATAGRAGVVTGLGLLTRGRLTGANLVFYRSTRRKGDSAPQVTKKVWRRRNS